MQQAADAAAWVDSSPQNSGWASCVSWVFESHATRAAPSRLPSSAATSTSGGGRLAPDNSCGRKRRHIVKYTSHQVDITSVEAMPPPAVRVPFVFQHVLHVIIMHLMSCDLRPAHGWGRLLIALSGDASQWHASTLSSSCYCPLLHRGTAAKAVPEHRPPPRPDCNLLMALA